MTNVTVHHSIHTIGKNTWNKLCGTDYPFLRFEFLAALEDSKCVDHNTGWHSCHLALSSDTDTIAVMPLYLKTHSYGEYVFDWAWADAYHQNGIEYYPKLINAIPYTPAQGPRIGYCNSLKAAIPFFIDAIKKLGQKFDASSAHCLFPDPSLSQQLNTHNWILRTGCQYHWFNQNYTSFEHFLDQCSSRKRKSLRKERTKTQSHGIKLTRYIGKDITDEHIVSFHHFYQATYIKRGQQGYLNLEFFKLLKNNMADQLLLIIAEKDNKPVAAALFFHSSNTLYGRYWGCMEKYDSLHFETCYYQGIEYCIERNLERFDPGAQGEHKVQRGFHPIKTSSYHWLSAPHFQQAIRHFTQQEGIAIEQKISELNKKLPFKILT